MLTDCSSAMYDIMTKQCDVVKGTEPVTFEESESSKLLVPLKQVNVCKTTGVIAMSVIHG